MREHHSNCRCSECYPEGWPENNHISSVRWITKRIWPLVFAVIWIGAMIYFGVGGPILHCD